MLSECSGLIKDGYNYYVNETGATDNAHLNALHEDFNAELNRLYDLLTGDSDEVDFVL